MDFQRQHVFRDVLDVLDSLQVADNLGTIKREMDSFVSSKGCECFLISRMPEERSVNLAPLLIAGRASAEWLAQYEHDQLYRHDPVTSRLRTAKAPFRWSEIVIDRRRQPEAWRALGSFRAFGKHEGLSVPIAGPDGFRGYVSLAGRQIDDAPDTMPAIQMVSLFAFGAVERLSRAEIRRVQGALTAREREVLRWIAVGKTQSEVGEILSISERTVEEHLRNARTKLGTVTTAHSVALALSTREISL
jgi:LuxR family quorum sensing-dependent transcriptional regulator